MPDCQSPNGLPCGSSAMTIVPIGPTSIGSTITVPPASLMRAAVAAASSAAKYVVQRGGSFGSCCGPMPPAIRPFRVTVR